MKIIVGSTSVHKLEAVRAAVARIPALKGYEVIGFKATSGVPEQPVGLDEIARGARQRARHAARENSVAICVGIENGIIRGHDGTAPFTVDLAVIAVLMPDGRVIQSTSTGIKLPEHLVRAAEKLGYDQHTVSSLIARDYGGDGTDPHSTLTHGQISRSQTMIDAVFACFCQLF